MRALMLLATLLLLLQANTQSMRPATYETIETANKLIDTKRFSEADSLLMATLSETSKMRKYDLAFLYNALGYLTIQQEDYKKALQYYEKALAFQVLPKAMRHSVEITVIQILLQTGAFQQSIDRLKALHKERKPSSITAKLMMAAYVSLESLSNALHWANEAVRLTSEPSAPLYQTKLALELQLQAFEAAETTLYYMLEHFEPKLIYFKQLAFLLNQRGETAKSVAVLESAYQMGLLHDKEDLIQLATLFLQQGSAIKGVQILSPLAAKMPKNDKLQTLLTRMLLESREFYQALDALQKYYNASKKPRTALMLAKLYAQKADWEQVLHYCHKAQKLDESLLLHAIALVQTGEYKKASTLFIQAKAIPQLHDQATMWLKHLNR